MHKRNPFSGDNGGDPPGFDVQPGGLRVAAVFSASLFFASTLPLPLVPVMMNSLLLLAAMVTAALAAIGGEHPFAAHVTRWDEAAVYSVLAFIAAALVDPTAAQGAIQILAADGSVSAGGPSS